MTSDTIERVDYTLEKSTLEKSIAAKTTAPPTNPDLKYADHISHYYKSPLSSVAYHHDVDCITRYFSDQFPLHIAVHQISAADEATRTYTELHTHECDEINILLGEPGDVTYDIQLGDENYKVDSCSCIWIPAGLPHSANVLKGSGYYVAIRLHSSQASSNPLEQIKHIIK